MISKILVEEIRLFDKEKIFIIKRCSEKILEVIENIFKEK